jgi:hypothetical protein
MSKDSKKRVTRLDYQAFEPETHTKRQATQHGCLRSLLGVGIGTLPTPAFSRQRVCPSPQNRGGGGAHSPAGEGLGESKFRRLEKSLALCLLCALPLNFPENVTASVCLLCTVPYGSARLDPLSKHLYVLKYITLWSVEVFICLPGLIARVRIV